MKLRALRLHNVRRFAAHGVAIEGIDDGVNVLAESNEHGKSTCFDALHALFFASHKTKPKQVQQLRPYSGGAVTVEADIEEDGALFRVRKRYFGSVLAQVSEPATGRIIAQADEAERWIAGRIKGGAGGPAGLLWVQQGLVEMNSRTGKANEEEKAAREDVLTSVSGEIEMLTGGKRTTQVLAKCDDALDRLVTATGKPKTGGPYAAAKADFDTLEEQAQQLAERVAELRDDLDKRQSARRQLDDLQDPAAATRNADALRAADTVLKQAEEHDGRLSSALLAERLAAQERDTAQNALDQFDATLAEIAKLDKRAAGETTDLEKAEAALQAAQNADTDAAAAVTARRDDLKKAQDAFDRAQRAALADAAREQLKRMRKTLANAEAARRDAETVRGEAEALALPESKITKLEKVEDSITALTAELRAASVSISVSYSDPTSEAIRRDGTVLRDRTQIAVDETLRLDIEGVGSLTVRPGSQDGTATLANSLDKEGAHRTALLASLGVGNLAEARARIERCKEKKQLAGQHGARLDALAPDGLDALRQQVSRKDNEAGLADEPTAPPTTLEPLRDAARTARDDAERRHAETQAALREYAKTVERVKTGLSRTQDALAQQSAKLGGEADHRDHRAAMTGTLAEKTRAQEEAKAAADVLRTSAPDLDALRAAQKRAAGVVARTREEIDTLKLTISTLNGKISNHAETAIEETLGEIEGRRDLTAQRVTDLETEIATLQKLRAVLTEARTDAKEHFFDPIVRELRPLLDIVFKDASITFDETTLLPVTIQRDGLKEDFGVLSGGMREQVTILTRLAFARLLARGGRPVPVILDDALIYSDDDRIERMFTALHRSAADLQILVFTCRQRAFRELGAIQLKLALWEPDGR